MGPRIQALCIGTAESQPLDHQGSPRASLFCNLMSSDSPKYQTERLWDPQMRVVILTLTLVSV